MLEKMQVFAADKSGIRTQDHHDEGNEPFSSQLEVLCRLRQQNLTITSTGRYMRVELNTNSFVFGRGFHFMYSGGDFQVQRHIDVTDDGLIQIFSPGHPTYFEGKYHLTWRIQTGSLEKIIQMIVKESHLPYNHKCGTDYLEAYDGYDSLTTSLAKWCGDEKPSKDSSGSQMFIVFHASSVGTRGVFKINFFVVLKSQQESGGMKTITILLSCIAVVLVPAVLFSVYRIRQRRYHRSSRTNRAFVATTMSSNPALQVPHQAAMMPATETGGEIELPPYTSAAQSQPPPSYESLEFGPKSGK
ncbi:cubilin-like isoform X2 [Haliotis rubra]|uniref:cubilin-like isoform X2 n=1 Tax=Haliotis rubra TaxID=36100 RepID=UPI001EE5B69F|nr:cubilin-like isoform X2 [Haliotis rubra]